MDDDRNVNLISCRVCGVIMPRLARDICSKCFKEEEELFQKIKAFLRANPGATITHVAEEIDCTEKQVADFVASGRLERIGAQVSHPCQICQKMITDGMICQDCKRDLKEQVSDLRDKSDQESLDAEKRKLDLDKKKSPGEGGHVGKRKG